jgi:hypothetical protein
MKRALTAAIVGGLLVFAVPQLASADHGADPKGDCAGQPSGTHESPEQAPRERPYGDREQEDSDGGEILF